MRLPSRDRVMYTSDRQPPCACYWLDGAVRVALDHWALLCYHVYFTLTHCQTASTIHLHESFLIHPLHAIRRPYSVASDWWALFITTNALTLRLTDTPTPPSCWSLQILTCLPLKSGMYCNPSVTRAPSPLSLQPTPASSQHSNPIYTPSDRSLLLRLQHIRAHLPVHDSDPAKANMTVLMMCIHINVVFRGILAALKAVSIPFQIEQYGASIGFASACMTGKVFHNLFIYS